MQDIIYKQNGPTVSQEIHSGYFYLRLNEPAPMHFLNKLELVNIFEGFEPPRDIYGMILRFMF